jgi:hypothetical protein
MLRRERKAIWGEKSAGMKGMVLRMGRDRRSFA